MTGTSARTVHEKHTPLTIPSENTENCTVGTVMLSLYIQLVLHETQSSIGKADQYQDELVNFALHSAQLNFSAYVLCTLY